MDPIEAGVPNPTLGRIVIYRARTAAYDVPAVITATSETLDPEGVELGHVPPLTAPGNVHLTVLTPGIPGTARTGNAVNEQQTSGCYQEHDIPLNDPASGEIRPGSWRWPVIR